MKNKLYKYNHTMSYYVTRNIFLIFGLFVGLACAIMVPTTINLLSKEPLKLNAAENTTEVSDDSSEDANDLASYIEE